MGLVRVRAWVSVRLRVRVRVVVKCGYCTQQVLEGNPNPNPNGYCRQQVLEGLFGELDIDSSGSLSTSEFYFLRPFVRLPGLG